MKNIKFSLIVLILLSTLRFAFAGEGMWLPFLLKQLNEKEMKAMGMKMSAEDIYNVNKGSLKDAIGHFGGGCTSEIISAEGLLLTNHHCGYGYIQRYSTLENNYLEEGFWAMNRADEIPCEGLFVTLISYMDDVTEMVLDGVGEYLSAGERQSIIDKNIAAIKAGATLNPFEEMIIKPFFSGNQFIKIVTVTYNDVRMVGAPPSSIGAFGKDTDNWVWPRHSGDFSLFRIYAGADNKPAAYSADNKPFQPKHFLPVSLDGVEQGDFTLVFGFPGRTKEYLPSIAVKHIVEVLDPARIAIRDIALKIVDAEMRADPEVKIQYASKYARISNYWKKWKGEILGLTKSNAVAKKEAYEKNFQMKISKKKKWREQYGTLLSDFDSLYQAVAPYALAREYYNEICRRNTELLSLTNFLSRWVDIYKNEGAEAFNERRDYMKNRIEGFYKNYRPEVDQVVFQGLMEKYITGMDEAYHPEILKEELALSNNDYYSVTNINYNE